ncbi:MAG TPA: glycosyltransferase family 2 protein [Gaiellaceae bacterium]|nr:glycosyltransferase family 2 protein [Gaiellaceae bacterium]
MSRSEQSRATPRVAVVVPCFNDGATLPDTLASLRDEEPHELVVVDDGSDDAATTSELERLAAGGVRIVRRANGGLSAARMTGVEATSARYVLPLDADDALVPGSLAALADALDAAPDAAVAWGDVEMWGEQAAHLDVARSLDPWLLTFINDVPVASMIRRVALLAAGGWSMGSGYEDWDLWLALAERGHTGVHVPRPTLRYRRRPGRMLADCTPQHAALYARLRERHAALFAQRRRNRRRSQAPLRARLLFPAIETLPLDPFTRHRAYLLVNRPRQTLSLRRDRRAAAA